MSVNQLFRDFSLGEKDLEDLVPVEDPVLGGEEDAVPGAVIAIQSFGDLLGFNSHLHVLASDGCFNGQGMFRVAPRFETKQLEEIFRHKIFKMLLRKGKITQDLVNPASAGENLARYTCPPLEDHPGLILPGADDIFP